MALTITYTPGYVWTLGELITEDKLNLAANPTINLEGSINSTSIADGSITTAKLATGALSADVTGRSKMADQFLVAAKLGADVAGDGLQGGAGLPIAAKPDLLTLETNGGNLRIKSTGAGVIASSRNLIAANNAGTPNTKIDVSADEVALKDATGGNPFLVSALAVTIDATVTGANGLDTGALGASAWYYTWVIAKTDGTKAGLLSLSTTAPTMPAGYTYKALIGAVRTNGSTQFWNFYQTDRDIFINDTAVFTGKTGVTVWTAITGADLTAMQGLVPPMAKMAWGSAGCNGVGNAGIAIGADANALGAQVSGVSSASTVPVLSYTVGGCWRAPLKTAQTIYYIMASTGTGYRVSVSGFRI